MLQVHLIVDKLYLRYPPGIGTSVMVSKVGGMSASWIALLRQPFRLSIPTYYELGGHWTVHTTLQIDLLHPAGLKRKSMS